MANKSIGLLTFAFGANMKGFDRALKNSQKKLKKFGKNIQRTGQNLSRNLTLPIAALGVGALKTFADFEQSMLKVKAVSGATDTQFAALTKSAKDLGSTTMFTASQVSELQLELSKLGMTPEEINKSTGAVLSLAQATGSDLRQSAEVTAKTMNAFGLEADDTTMIADVMADSFSSTALDMTKFETAMSSVAPVAKQAGASLQQTTAVLGVLVNNGVEASSAGTALRNIFLELSKKGMSWGQAMKAINTAQDPLAKSFELFGKRGANVATIIAQNGIEIKNLTKDFIDSSGEAQAMANIMDSGVAGAMRRLRSQLEGVAIEFGEVLVPVFSKVSEKISKLMKWFSGLSKEQKESIVKWALVVAAIGPALIVFGKLAIGLSSIIGLLGKTKIAVVGLMKFIPKLWATLLANPFVALGAVIAAVVLKLTIFSDKAIKAREEQEKLNEAIKETQETAMEKHDILAKLKLWSKLSKRQKENLLEQVRLHKENLEDQKLSLIQDSQKHEGIIKLKKEIKSYRELMKKKTDDPLELAKIASAPQMIEQLKSKIKNLQKTITQGKGLKGFTSEIGQMDSILETYNITLEETSDGAVDLDKLMDQLNTTFDDGTESTKKLNKETEKFLDNYELFITRTKEDVPKLSGVAVPDYEAPTMQQTGWDVFYINLGFYMDRFKSSWEEIGPVVKKVFSGITDVVSAFSEKETRLFENDKKRKETALDKEYEKRRENIENSIIDEEAKNEAIENLDAEFATKRETMAEVLAEKEKEIKKKQAKRNKAIALMDAIVSTASSVAESLPNIPLAIASGALGAAQIAIISSTPIPEFAEGGIVSGPTLGIMGEYSNAKSNPEVIAPLDKLKNMIGGENQKIEVVGRLIGNDIYLSNKKTAFNRLRTT